MKVDIHPKYFDAVEIRCSCGNVIVSGSTKEKLKTELCSKCHPFYTGQQKLVDTAGRVDKFEAKRRKFAELETAAKQRAETRKKKPEAYKEKEIPAEVLERALAAEKPQGKWGKPLGDAPAEEVIKEEVAEAKKAKKGSMKKKPAKKTAEKKMPKKKSGKK
jgi:large subunit ribosomal protein L31